MRRVVLVVMALVAAAILSPQSGAISQAAPAPSPADATSDPYSDAERGDLAWQASVTEEKDKLVEAGMQDANFAGGRFDNENQSLVLMGVGKPSRELSALMDSLAPILPSSWQAVDFSAAELNKAADSMPLSASGIHTVEIERDFSGLVAISSTSPAPRVRDVTVSRGSDSLAVPVRYEVGEVSTALGRGSDSAPFLGGSRVIRPNDEVCSLGFRVLQGDNGRMLTARHCTAQGNDTGGNAGVPFSMFGSGDNVGSSTGQALANRDVQLIDGASYENKIWRGDQNGFESTYAGGSGAPVQDEIMCVSGGFSGSQCGYVQILFANPTVCLGPPHNSCFNLQGAVRVDDRGGESIAGGGDSGSPAYTDLSPNNIRLAGILNAGVTTPGAIAPCNGFTAPWRQCSTQVFISVWSRFNDEFNPDLTLP